MPAPGSVAVWQTVRQLVTLGGTPIPNAFATRITAGASRRYMEATVYCAGDPIGFNLTGALDQTVEIQCGASNTNYRTRFRGNYKQPLRALWPGVTQLVCKGELFKASIARNPNMLSLDPLTNRPGVVGIDLSTIGAGQVIVPPATTSSNPAGQSDQAMVSYLLGQSGCNFAPGYIGGTGRLFGTQAGGFVDQTGLPTGPFIWGGRTTALSMIESIDEVSIDPTGTMAYRTLESLGGVIYRVPMGGRPRNSFDVGQFVEGVDIFKADQSEGGMIELGNFAVVSGWDDGGGLGSVITILRGSNPYQSGGVGYGDNGDLSNPMIEFQSELPVIAAAPGRDFAANGRGMSTELQAQYVLNQVNRLTKHLTMQTPRDDYCGPGQTHGVLLTSLQQTEPLWLQEVTIETNVQSGTWMQTFVYQGGGVESGVLPPQ